MLSEYDVEMPKHEKAAVEDSSEEQIHRITELLKEVSKVESRQELRLKEDYYNRFNWFGQKSDHSYYSYQEEAVYDFVFNLNKSGILSDQVGMGKTIEAGMIISELASRNELRSLLIIVPNEIMSRKWEYELEEKFGIKKYTQNGVTFPEVKSLSCISDFYISVFEAFRSEIGFGITTKGARLAENEAAPVLTITHSQDDSSGRDIAEVLINYFKKDIYCVIDALKNSFSDVGLDIDGLRYDATAEKIVLASEKFNAELTLKFGSSKAVADYMRSVPNGERQLESVFRRVENFNRKYIALLEAELASLYALLGKFLTMHPEESARISGGLSKKYPILVVPISSTDSQTGATTPFLNHELAPEIKNYRHEYSTHDGEGIIPYYESYKVIDFFIDAAYQTVIVDEVHDYIDVRAKVNTDDFHLRQAEFIEKYPAKQFNRYELFDDYYFIEKTSLYKKLKDLADKAKRKIFLTATPIKSDMVDFYLLTLLACNKDAETYEVLSRDLDTADPKSIDDIRQSVYKCITEIAAEFFTDHHSEYLREAPKNSAGNKYAFPYMHTQYIEKNASDAENIKNYLLSHFSYMSINEVVMNLLSAYKLETKHEDGAIDQRLDDVNSLLLNDGILELMKGIEPTSDMRTRVVFRALLDNPIRLRFEEDFIGENNEPIKRIRDMLVLKDGPRRWYNTYRKYGIRHTRHQTYNLGNFPDASVTDMLKSGKMERYRNLPIWPKRNGNVIYLQRIDRFFDSYLTTRNKDISALHSGEVDIESLPNYGTLKGTEASKQKRFAAAKQLFAYINDSMSGGDEHHLPQHSYYESVQIGDENMIEYKLALVNKLMEGTDASLGNINNMVLLFADGRYRDIITKWFAYQGCSPLTEKLGAINESTKKKFDKAFERYGISSVKQSWRVSEQTDDINRYRGNLLVIIDPKRYEKGVDLQKANTIINFDINYDPLKMEQRIGRIDRIRPASQEQSINIISFVPLNDMSGFVINFFANEMLMFTQWMGETTGIVSVPEESRENVQTSEAKEDISFEGNVNKLEKFYLILYRLCTEEVDRTDIDHAADEFSAEFGTDKDFTKADFVYINAMRKVYEKMFVNSIYKGRRDDSDKDKVVRFNSRRNVFLDCSDARDCNKCPNYSQCKSEGGEGVVNSYSEFTKAAEKFAGESIKFYENMLSTLSARGTLVQGQDNKMSRQDAFFRSRRKEFEELKSKLKTNLKSDPMKPFVMTIKEFDAIMNPIKKLYWDDVVKRYIDRVLKQFYKQCDSVLESAAMFEKFIKTLSIAEFMSNMDENVEFDDEIITEE